MKEPSLLDLIAAVVRRRWWGIAGSLVGAIVGVAVALLTRPQYSVEVVISPVIESEGLGSIASSLGNVGGLTSLLGVNLPGQRNADRELAILRSRDFTTRFIQDQNLLPELFPDKWDAKAGDWKANLKRPPNLAEGVKRFQTEVRSMAEDRRTGIVRISLTWYPRERLAGWANTMIDRVNEQLRAQTIEESQRSLDFIQAQLAKAQEIELRESLFKLTESHIKTMTLAQVRRDFAFQVIDPAVTPEPRDKVKPRRAATVLAATLIGFVAGLLASMLPAFAGAVRARVARD